MTHRRDILCHYEPSPGVSNHNINWLCVGLSLASAMIALAIGVHEGRQDMKLAELAAAINFSAMLVNLFVISN